MDFKILVFTLIGIFLVFTIGFNQEAHAACTDPPAPGVDWSDCDKSSQDLSGANLSGANLSGGFFDSTIFVGTNLSGADLSNANIQKALFLNADLSGADFTGTNFGCHISCPSFTNADLSNAIMPGAFLANANFGCPSNCANLSGVNLSGADFFIFINPFFFLVDLSNANLSGADLSGADIRNVHLSSTNLSGVDFTGTIFGCPNDCPGFFNNDFSNAIMPGADLSGIDMGGANFSGADLSNANFFGTMLSVINFSGADISGVDFSEADLGGSMSSLSGAITGCPLNCPTFFRTVLSGVDFGCPTNCPDLSGANLLQANLVLTNLSGGKFSEANLSTVNLFGSDLSGADLFAADLSCFDVFNCTILINADLSSADLSESDLSGADLDGANLSGANLSGANITCLNHPMCDTDGDTVINGNDNCITVSNIGQEDTDMDGAGDVCEPCHSSYVLNPNLLNFNDAELAANTLGAHLATIRSSSQNSEAGKLASGVWIGFNDISTEGTFEWTSGFGVPYTNWGPGEPNDAGGNEDATEMSSTGLWNDVDKGTLRSSVIDTIDANCDQTGFLEYNGSFELGSPVPGSFITLGAGDTSVHGWTVGGNSVDFVNTDWEHADGNRSFDVSGADAGSLSQTFTIIPGTDYGVSFYMAGNAAAGPVVKEMQVKASWNGGEHSETFSFDTTGRSPINMGWTEKVFLFTIPTLTTPLTTLTFTSQTNTAFGPTLDNVRVFIADIDGDSVLAIHDNCPAVANPGQEDFDGDGVGNVCDPNTEITTNTAAIDTTFGGDLTVDGATFLIPSGIIVEFDFENYKITVKGPNVKILIQGTIT